MDVVWKGIVGGLFTALVVWLSKRGNVLPGIIPLFPTFGLVALYIVGARGEPGGFRQTCTALVKTLPAYLAFMIVCYFFGERWSFRLTLAVGLAAWFVVALATFLLPQYLRGH
ncbi:MAG: GlpM family protein [Anaerolineae bacterium]|nr:GlpM family protein [Anaerolineae bacterium]